MVHVSNCSWGRHGPCLGSCQTFAPAPPAGAQLHPVKKAVIAKANLSCKGRRRFRSTAASKRGRSMYYWRLRRQHIRSRLDLWLQMWMPQMPRSTTRASSRPSCSSTAPLWSQGAGAGEAGDSSKGMEQAGARPSGLSPATWDLTRLPAWWCWPPSGGKALFTPSSASRLLFFSPT